MSRPSISSQCDSVASYMDGIHVKIAEAYKPPRKVGLPAVYNNKLPDTSKFTYDFNLERSVLEKMAEWREIRQANSEARLARLEEKKKREQEESPPTSPPSSEVANQVAVKIIPLSKTTILTPQPLSSHTNNLQNHAKVNGLDFADFDNDTSSPFDNMELKTINDMEELAQVLQPTSQWMSSTNLESVINELRIDKQPISSPEEEHDDKNCHTTDDEDSDANSNIKHRCISTIIQELQRELKQPVTESWKPWSDLQTPDRELCDKQKQECSTVSSNIHLFSNFMEEDKKLAQHLSDMGFPLSRIARAICDFGDQDNKRIIEYLLAIQTLEESGIPAEDAEKALILTQYNPDKAKLYHKNLCILKDLGFPEDKASIALLNCDIDRDRALDFLIS